MAAREREHLVGPQFGDRRRPGQGVMSITRIEPTTGDGSGNNRRRRERQSAASGLGHCKGAATAVQAGIVRGPAARPHRTQPVHVASLPAEGHACHPQLAGQHRTVVGPDGRRGRQGAERPRAIRNGPCGSAHRPVECQTVKPTCLNKPATQSKGSLGVCPCRCSRTWSRAISASASRTRAAS